MSESRRYRRANGIKGDAVREAIDSPTPLNALYTLIPKNRRNALDRFVRLLGKSPDDLREALRKERNCE